MRCSPCGATYQEPSARCPECGAIQDNLSPEPSAQTHAEQVDVLEKTALSVHTKKVAAAANRSLIEFPGVNRTAMPEWRKELGERVREVQVRRAREALLETGASEPLFNKLEANSAPILELLPQAETPPLNPLVVAALQRIERAHSQPTGNAMVATAVMYEEQEEFALDVAPDDKVTLPTPKPERAHNLAVVPTPTVVTSEIPQLPRKPIRVIDGHNDPALNYLDSIPTSIIVECRAYRSAPIYLRMPTALVDLLFVCFLSSPFLALTQLANLDWRNPRVIGFAVVTFLVVGFLYLTIGIALTGRTLGMKLFALRVVDARTGLIPTGSQSAGRAFVYMLSLASAGVALIYTLLNSEKHTAHDRLTRTAVIRV